MYGRPASVDDDRTGSDLNTRYDVANLDFFDQVAAAIHRLQNLRALVKQVGRA